MPDRREQPEEIVDLTSAGWNSRQGRYFIGQTGELQLGQFYNAWGGIVNPCHSGVNLYFDIFTVTNYTDSNFTAEIWLNSKPPSGALFLPVVPSNQSDLQPQRPKAHMMQADYIKEKLDGGINIFDRIVTSNSTLVSDSHQGSIILGPGETFSILLKSQGCRATATIVLTWWEEKIRRR
jgi:hypothetical protein